MQHFIEPSMGMGNPAGLGGASNDALPLLNPIRKIQSTTAALMPMVNANHHHLTNNEGGYTNASNFILGGGSMPCGTELVCQEKFVGAAKQQQDFNRLTRQPSVTQSTQNMTTSESKADKNMYNGQKILSERQVHSAASK